jgi:hypothetical protein
MSIKDLDAATPTDAANAGLGASEFRALKTALQACFGEVDGPVKAGAAGALATDVELTDLFDRVTQAEADIVTLGGGVAASGTFELGMIMMWGGSTANIPALWRLCDGSTYGPVISADLRDKFIVGAGGSYAPAATGGLVSATSSATSPGATDGTPLTVANMPAALPGALSVSHQTGGDGIQHDDTTSAAGGESGSSNNPRSIITGSGFNGTAHAHPHTATHTHTVATLPPYFALCYIVYVGY